MSPRLLSTAYNATWGRVFAAMYDRMLAKAEVGKLGRLRHDLVAPLTGIVVDVGAGTGVNLRHFGEDAEVTMVEPDRFMAARLAVKASDLGRSVDVLLAPGEALPLPDNSADHVLCTLVLCTAEDPAAVLAEAFRVLKPGGEVHFLEHVRSDDPKVARIQDRLRGPWSLLGCGCQANRKTGLLFTPAGFVVEQIGREHLKGCGPMVSEVIVGTARKPLRSA
ncbi:MAG: class I SAM-dependent methyltransferase [Actinomycetota bacterium]